MKSTTKGATICIATTTITTTTTTTATTTTTEPSCPKKDILTKS